MSTVPTPQDLDRLVDSIYAMAFELSWHQFRAHALEQLCHWIGASSAEWLTRAGNELPGEHAVWPQHTGAGLDAMRTIRFAAGQRERVFEPLPMVLVAGADAAPGEHGLALQVAHRGTHLHSVVLLRFAAAVALQGDNLHRAVGHLVQAGTLALRQFIQRDEWLQALGRPSRGSAALIDQQGSIYVASARFRSFVGDQHGDPEFARLPFPLPVDVLEQGQGDFFVGRLHFRLNREGGLFLLHARRPHPLDVLSPREQEIARALAQGKTFKSVAREYDIAISTVANHASRIYKKLGIYRREELVGLLRTAAVEKAA